MVIVAVMDNPGFCGMGAHYFNEAEWPVEGYTAIRRIITDRSAAEVQYGGKTRCG